MTNEKPKVNPTEIVATLRDVTVTYDGYQTRALSHVSVEFRRGEVTGVLGARGAGKSTALKILAGQMSPTEGKVKAFGKSPRGSGKARVGYLPGRVDLNRPPGFVDRLLGRKRKSSPAGRGLARLAQAMLGNRDLLVLDDVFADLNAAEWAEAKSLVRDLVSRRKTVVLSSDSLMDIKDLCERLVILHEGKVQAIGTLDELLSSASAIRFLPAVLPNEMVERVLTMLRNEILSTSSSIAAMPPTSTGKKMHPSPKDEMPGATSSSKLTQSTAPEDTINHEKLEGLVKPPKAR